MTVRVPISADASSVVSAFAEIQAAIDKAGQAGKKFEDIDLSHPELKHVAADLQRMRQNFEDLRRLGRGETAAAVRSGGFNDVLDWFEHHQRMYPDEAARVRHRAQAGRYILQGTSWEPRPPPSPQQSPEPTPAPNNSPTPSGGGSGGQNRAGIVNTFTSGAKFFLGMAGLGGIADMAGKAIHGAQDEAISTDTLFRTLRDTNESFEQLRDSVRDTAKGLQLTYSEAQRLSLTWAHLTNQSRASQVQDYVRFGVGFARGYGMDPAAAIGGMGQAAFLGEAPKEFALMVGETIREAGMNGRSTEVMSALLHWTQSATRMLVTHSDVEGFASMYAGLNASAMPGFKGQNAEDLIQRINAAVMQGGAAGAASQALAYRAFARHGITDPYEIQYRLAGGMFEHIGSNGQGPTTFEMLRRELRRDYAGVHDPYRVWSAEASEFGISIRQAEGLDKYFGYADTLKGSKFFARMHFDPTKIHNPTALADIGEVVGATPAGLDQWKQRMMGRGDIPEAERAKLANLEGDQLRAAMVKMLGQYGEMPTQGSETRQSMADFSNALTKAGTTFLSATNDFRDSVSRLGSMLGDAGTKFNDWISHQHDGSAPGPDDFNTDPLGGAALATGEMRAMGGSGAGKGGAHINSDVAKARAAEAYGMFTRAGYTPQQAAGLVANMDAESGFNAQNVGDNGLAYGVFQWHPDRQAEFATMFHHNIRQSTFEEQVRFKIWELNNTEKAAGDRIRADKTAYAAARDDSRLDQRPAGGFAEAARRGNMGAEWAGQLVPAPIGSAPAPAAAQGDSSHGINITVGNLEVTHRQAEDGSIIKQEHLPVTAVKSGVSAGRDIVTAGY